MYKLFFDSSCPVCSSFVNMIRSKIDSSKIEFLPMTSNENNFKIELPNGKTYFGKDAVTKLYKEFPEILNYFWMLPDKFKPAALQMTYKIGSLARTILKKTGCNCGK